MENVLRRDNCGEDQARSLVRLEIQKTRAQRHLLKEKVSPLFFPHSDSIHTTELN